MKRQSVYPQGSKRPKCLFEKLYYAQKNKFSIETLRMIIISKYGGWSIGYTSEPLFEKAKQQTKIYQ